HPGTCSRNILNPDGEARELPGKCLITLKKGDILRHILAGAGGWGDPFERDPERVLEDVRNEKISLESARRDFGVAIDPKTLTLDIGATQTLRAKKKRA
ncbi:MAG: hydantoinase B/oxoprolinase family protein, partial [bacterium]|nr:hydantoinase B/oxoprolinase family protein [bacterium]